MIAARIEQELQIAAVDEAASAFGLAPGMGLATARAMHPALDVVEADAAADAALLGAIADWCDRYTPLVALDPPDGLLLDVTGCAHLFGGEKVMLERVCSALAGQGFAIRAAIAGTSVAARALARHRHGRIVATGEEAIALQPLPVTALGAGAAITQGLRRAGLKTIGDVASRASSELASRFGADFVETLRQALGQSDAPISPRRPMPDYVVEKRFAEPIATQDTIAATLGALAQMLVVAMARHGKGARRIEAAFFRTDGAVRTIAIEAGQPVTDAAVLMRLCNERLGALADPIDPGFGFDLIRLAALETVTVTPQQRGFDSAANDTADVAQLVDRLSARLGPQRVLRYLPQDTHIPERAALAAPAREILSDARAWPARAAGEPPLRPLRLFAQPEPIEVMAEVPHGPPVQFNWRRVRHGVARVEGPERVAMEWWRSGDMVLLTRDYFRIEDENGCRYWVYRDGLYEEVARKHAVEKKEGDPPAPGWFLHGLFA